MTKTYRLTSTLLLACAMFHLRAQDKADTTDVFALSEVVVTGTRTERSLATLPVPTQIVTGESIRKSGLSRLSEIIQEQTGLLTVPALGGGEGIQLQGLDAAYTMILIDGQPLVGRSAGTLDLTRITVNNIERIEIVKGASSCLYGSESLAGVVNIITRSPKPDGKFKLNTSYRLASFGTHDGSINLHYGKKKIAFELFGNVFSSAGYNLSGNQFLNTVEPFVNFTVQPKLKFFISEKLNLSVGSRFYGQSQVYRALVNMAGYEGQSDIREWNHTLLLKQTVTQKLKIEYDLYGTTYSATEFLNDSGSRRFDQMNYEQLLVRPEVRSYFTLGRNVLTIGIGANSEALARTSFRERANLQSGYVFGQYEWYIKKKINLLLGFRYDHHLQYQSQFSPKIGLNYKCNEYLSLKASVGYGYKAPDLRQLYLDFTNSSVGYTVLGYNVAASQLAAMIERGEILYSNNLGFEHPLKPESSMNINLGTHYKKGKWLLEGNLFYNNIRNLIDTRAIAQKNNGQNVFSYFNLNRIFTYGLEINATYKHSDQLSITLGYQYLEAKDQSVIELLGSGNIFARDPSTLSSFRLESSDYFGLYNRSKHTANLKINYELPVIKTSFNLRLFYRSKYGTFDTNNNSVLDKYDNFVSDYFLANLTVSKEFKHGFGLQLGINNIFGYTDPLNIPNLPGRQYFGKIQYQF